MKSEMPTDVRPRFWDRTERKYQITYPAYNGEQYAPTNMGNN